MDIFDYTEMLEKKLNLISKKLNNEVNPKFNKIVNSNFWFGILSNKEFQPFGGTISFTVLEYDGEDNEGTLVDFVTQYNPYNEDAIIKSDNIKQEILYVSCDVDIKRNEDFYREINLKDNANLKAELVILLTDLEIYILSKADLIVHIINNIFILPVSSIFHINEDGSYYLIRD